MGEINQAGRQFLLHEIGRAGLIRSLAGGRHTGNSLRGRQGFTEEYQTPDTTWSDKYGGQNCTKIS